MTSPTSTDAVALLREYAADALICNWCHAHLGSLEKHRPHCRLAKAIAEQPAEAVGELRDALEPFARAIDRLDHFGGHPGHAAHLYAMQGTGPLYELLNGIEGEPLTVAHLETARAALRTRIEAEDRAKSGGEQRNPDHVYDKADWEWTSTWDDRNTLTDELDVGEIIHVGTLYKGPDKWAARIDDVEVRWFDTREAAEVALAPTPSSEKSK